MVRRIFSLLVSLAIGASLVGYAAANDEEEAVNAVVARTTTLLNTPTGGRSLRTLSTGTRIAVLPLEKSGKFVYVGLPNGLEGWVQSEDLRIPNVSGSGTGPWSALPRENIACAASLAECPPEGCTSDPSHKIDPLLNEMKNVDLDDSTPVQIEWKICMSFRIMSTSLCDTTRVSVHRSHNNSALS